MTREATATRSPHAQLEESPPATTREGLRTATKTQHSQRKPQNPGPLQGPLC